MVFGKVIWSNKCKLKTYPHRNWGTDFEVAIISNNGKYGFVCRPCSGDDVQEQDLCSCQYDTVYNLQMRENEGCFVVYSEGKYGLIEICCSDSEQPLALYQQRINTEFDHIAFAENSIEILYLYRGNKTHYYNLKTGFLSEAYDRIDIDSCCVRIWSGNQLLVFQR